MCRDVKRHVQSHLAIKTCPPEIVCKQLQSQWDLDILQFVIQVNHINYLSAYVCRNRIPVTQFAATRIYDNTRGKSIIFIKEPVVKNAEVKPENIPVCIYGIVVRPHPRYLRA